MCLVFSDITVISSRCDVNVFAKECRADGGSAHEMVLIIIETGCLTSQVFSIPAFTCIIQ